MKKQFEIENLSDFRVGDVVVPNTEPGLITVEREVRFSATYGQVLSLAEEFVAAPVKTVVLDSNGDVWIKAWAGWRCLSSNERPDSHDMAESRFAPFVVLAVGGVLV